MNYYEHHIGDFAQATAHLSFVEDAAYSRLIRKYYAEERPLPADIKAVQRLTGARAKEERQAIADMLQEFFQLEEDGWHNKRCDAEIARYRDKQEKARASAQARWDKQPGKRKPSAMRTHSEGNAHQSPDTSHQTPDSKAVVSEASPPEGEPPAENATRVGGLCKQLRVIGIDAAPHLPVWPDLLERFTDEQIVAVAEIAKARKPDERIHLRYLVPILNEPPKAPHVGTKRKPAPDNFENRDYGTGGRL